MRRVVVKPNPAPGNADPARYHLHLRLDDGTEPRLRLAGFSYFGEIAGLHHIPETSYVVLYPEGDDDDFERSLYEGPKAGDTRLRFTYAQWIRLLASQRITMSRLFLFDLVEADSYPLFHRFGADKYDLARVSSRYLRRLTRYVELARRAGIVVQLCLGTTQTVRPRYWAFQPWNRANNTSGTIVDDRLELCRIRPPDAIPEGEAEEDAEQLYAVQRSLYTSIARAMKPFWNVVFELFNEAGVDPIQEVVPWHGKVARWLDAELFDAARGERTNLVTLNATDELLDAARAGGSILKQVLFDGNTPRARPLIDAVSFHGGQWGGPFAADSNPTDAQIVNDTRAKINAFYGRAVDAAGTKKVADWPIGVICDTDAHYRAQLDPGRYFRLVSNGLRVSLNHRWSEDFLSHGGLRNQVTNLGAQIPAGLAYPDAAAAPAPIPAVEADEAAVAGSWRSVAGTARDLGVFRSAAGQVWAVGTNAVPGGYGIYRWDGAAFTAVAGGAVRIAAGPDGPWVVNAANEIYRRDGSSWVRVAGAARDVGIGGDGTVWVIGTNAVPGGFGIHRWNGTGFTPIDGGGVRIAVGPTGLPWVVNDAGAIYRRDGSRWTLIPGATARDIGVGLDDTPWIVGTGAAPGGFGLCTFTGSGWREVEGGGTQISVDQDGLPWLANDAFAIFRRVVPETSP